MKLVAVLLLTACLAQGALSFESIQSIPAYENEVGSEDSTIGTILCYRGLIKQVKKVVEDAKALVARAQKCTGKGKDIFFNPEEEQDSSIARIICIRKLVKQAKQLVADVKDLVARFEKCTGLGKPDPETLQLLSEAISEDGVIGNVVCWTKFIQQITTFVKDAKDLVIKITSCTGGKDTELEKDGAIGTIVCITGVMKQINQLIKDGMAVIAQPSKCLAKPEPEMVLEEEIDEQCWLELIALLEETKNVVGPVYEELFSTIYDLYKRYEKCDSLPNETALQAARRKACFSALKAKAGVELIRWRKTLIVIGSDGVKIAAKLTECSAE